MINKNITYFEENLLKYFETNTNKDIIQLIN